MTDIKWGKKLPAKKNMFGHTAVQSGMGSNSRGYGSARVRTYVLCECGTRCSGQGWDGGMSSYRRHLLRKKPEIEKARKHEDNMAHIRERMSEWFPALHRELERIVSES